NPTSDICSKYCRLIPAAPTENPGGADRAKLDSFFRLRRKLRQQRSHEHRLAFVESVGVKRFLQRKQVVVEVMTDFVYQGAQECLEGNDLLPLHSAHPDGDARLRAVVLFGLVEPVQLAVIIRGPPQ